MTDIILDKFTSYFADILISDGIYDDLYSYIVQQYGENFVKSNDGLRFVSDNIEKLFDNIDFDFDDITYNIISNFIKDEGTAIWVIENCSYDKLYDWVYLGKVYSPNNDNV